MAVETSDLLSPLGRLQPAVLWPGLTTTQVTRKLEGFLEAAAAQGLMFATTAAADAWTSLWAQRRGFEEVYDRLMVMPSTVDVTNRGSTSYTGAQLDALKAKIDALTVAIDALEEGETAEDEGAYTVIQSLR